MTHTLHREGSIEDLKKDFVVIAMPTQGINIEGSGEKLKKFLLMAKKYNPINSGDSKQGNKFALGGINNLIDKVKDGGICHVVLNDPESLVSFLKDLKEEDLGISLVVSGLMDVVDECCQKTGLKRNSINMSLGIHGNTKKLVEDEVREVTTLCGHGMITGGLVLKMVDKIKKGKITPKEASDELAALCICGIYNTERSENILRRMALK